jgi:succinate dehydrogenase / fumarate reductase iron-sulfur subunit
MGAGPRISREAQEQNYPLSQCMSCGCCLEACPQFNKVELQRNPGESDEDFTKRKEAAYESEFIGAHAISQAMLFNSHPVAKSLEKERMETITSTGGIQACGNAQNCVAVCPKEIPLTTSIARAGRAATVYAFKKIFDR